MQEPTNAATYSDPHWVCRCDGESDNSRRPHRANCEGVQRVRNELAKVSELWRQMHEVNANAHIHRHAAEQALAAERASRQAWAVEAGQLDAIAALAEPVLVYASRGRGYVGADPAGYPDVEARRALGALMEHRADTAIDAGVLAEAEVSAHPSMDEVQP